MSFKRRMVRHQPAVVAASELLAVQATAGGSPELPAASSRAWEVAPSRVTRYTPLNVDRGRVVTRRTGGKASGHR